jgi:hypothetical protein
MTPVDQGARAETSSWFATPSPNSVAGSLPGFGPRAQGSEDTCDSTISSCMPSAPVVDPGQAAARQRGSR